MKILHLIQKRQNRGAETFACQLANHQVSQGHEVKVITLFSGEANLPWKGELLSLKASKKKRFIDFYAWKRLSMIVRDFQPDIVQANAGDTLKYAIFSKKIFKWKSPVVARNASEVGRYLNSYLQRIINNILYKNVDRVISVSKASEKDILSHFPFLNGKTEVIPIGLEKKSKIFPISFDRDKKSIIHVGGFTFEKNHLGLLKIFQKILEAEKQVTLELVGDGPLRDEIEMKVKEYALEDKINFHGFVDNPLSYIKAADVLVLPSIIEGLPGVLLEAMYCKIPVIAYDVGGISEIVSNVTGVLIEKGDENSFAESTIGVLRNPQMEQIEAAYDLVQKKFMNKEIALKFVNSYQKLVE